MMWVRGKGVVMKRGGMLALFSTVAILVFVVTAAAGDLTFGNPRTMTFPPVEFSPPEPERVMLDNGMVVYLL
ncbi:MAG TPA: hypothetical protein VLA47_05385, partial [Nitrospira sp.]|nr:hypothetical protein [Nitrospira sp.]